MTYTYWSFHGNAGTGAWVTVFADEAAVSNKGALTFYERRDGRSILVRAEPPKSWHSLFLNEPKNPVR